MYILSFFICVILASRLEEFQIISNYLVAQLTSTDSYSTWCIQRSKLQPFCRRARSDFRHRGLIFNKHSNFLEDKEGRDWLVGDILNTDGFITYL